jgi:hypothetical protein
MEQAFEGVVITGADAQVPPAADGLGDGVAVGLGDGDGLGDGLGLGEGEGLGDGDGLGEGLGFGLGDGDGLGAAFCTFKLKLTELDVPPDKPAATEKAETVIALLPFVRSVELKEIE